MSFWKSPEEEREYDEMEARLQAKPSQPSASPSKKGQSNKGEPKQIPTAQLSGLVDVCVDDKGEPVFLFCNNGALKTEYSIEHDGKIFIPPPRKAMPWILPRAKVVTDHFHNDNDQSLFHDIEKRIYANTELPNKRLYPFLAAWALHTHLIDQFYYSPIIIFHAVADKGKTRTCRTLLWMSRRGIHVETLREADIIRKASRFGSAFIFDVLDVWKKAERMGAEDILLSRFDAGITVPRVTRPEVRGFDDTEHFSCFGPTLIATNEPAHSILDSRGIVVNMREATRSLEDNPREIDFLDLKERATAFRARWMQKELPKVVKQAVNRLGDILQPIAQTFQMVAPERMAEFTELVAVFQNDRAEAKATTPEGDLVKALLNLEHEIFEGKIKTSQITESLNKGRAERYQVSPVTVGKRMAALGFSPVKVGSERGFLIEPQLLESLAKQYGHTESSVLSVPSVPKCPEPHENRPLGNTDFTSSRADRTVGTDGITQGVTQNDGVCELPEGF